MSEELAAEAPAATDVWAGVPEDSRGYIENKGWGGPADLLQSYQNLEKLRGVPEDHLVRLPTDQDDPNQWDNVYTKLGRPNEAKEYNFNVPDGADQTFVDKSKEWMHKAGLNNKQASQLAEQYASFEQEKVAAYQAQVQNYQSQTMDQLKQVWGNEYDTKVRLVDQTVEEFGFSDEMLTAIRDSGHGAEFMRKMEAVAMRSGEARYVEGDERASQGFGVTPEAAKAQLEALTMDSDWLAAFMDRNHPAHRAAVDKKSRLVKVAYGS